jgi:hypothetical protein
MKRSTQLWGSAGLFFVAIALVIGASAVKMMGVALIGFGLMPVAVISMVIALFRKSPAASQPVQGQVAASTDAAPGGNQTAAPVAASSMSLSSRQAIVVLGIAGVIVVLYLLFGGGGSLGGLGSRYTRAQFDRVSTGMSVSEVSSIMGGSGELSVDSNVAGYSGQIYTWKNPDGSNMLVQFQNGSAITKAQAGLR